MEKEIKGYKGFDKDLKCRGYQYEVGKDYEHNGEVSCCNSGFHFCENPMDVLAYYNPAGSRYCEVKGSGTTDKDTNDAKVAVSKLHISAEIGLKGLIEAGVKFILDNVNWKDNRESNTGYQSAATVEGKDSIAIVTGYDSKAKGALGCWIVLTERVGWNGNGYPIKEVKAFLVDGEIIKADTFYKLIDGEAVEVE